MSNPTELEGEQCNGNIVSDSAREMVCALIGAVVVIAALLYFVWASLR